MKLSLRNSCEKNKRDWNYCIVETFCLTKVNNLLKYIHSAKCRLQLRLQMRLSSLPCMFSCGACCWHAKLGSAILRAEMPARLPIIGNELATIFWLTHWQATIQIEIKLPTHARGRELQRKREREGERSRAGSAAEAEADVAVGQTGQRQRQLQLPKSAG